MKPVERNAHCPCGSGKKYKNCCLKKEAAFQEAPYQKAHEQKSSGQVPDHLLQTALQHHQAGRLPEAEALYQQILQVAPDNADALHLSGLIAYQTGKIDAAIELIRKAICIKPSAQMHYNLGNAYKDQGNPDAAVENFRKALSIKPDYPQAYNNLGSTLQAQGKLVAATESFRKALSLKPDYAETHNNLGIALRAQGESNAAEKSYRQALLLKPNFAEAYYNLGNTLQDHGRLGEAAASYRQALSLKPDYAEPYRNLGWVLQTQGRLEEATENFEKALLLAPNKVESHSNLGNILLERGHLAPAIEHYRQALLLRPDFAEIYFNLAGALGLQGKLDEARVNYQKAFSLKPDYANAHAALAGIYVDLGQFEAAQIAISKALELQPGNPTALATLTRFKKMTPEDSEWLNMALAVSSQTNSNISPAEAIGMHFAIGKYYDDTRQYDLAFAAYRRGNMLKRQREGVLDRAGVSRLVDALMTTYTKEVVCQQREGASLSQRPVLIVGMPRSGTSLVEQIIASHPEAAGAGELFFWGSQAKANPVAVMSGNYEPALLARIAAAYEQILQQYSPEVARVVDKMPDNFFGLGLISATFPQARIIHTQRNPVDTCLSIYFQNFGPTYSYGTDLDDLAFYYREYTRLMQHWRAVLPAERFLEVPYEALVDDQTAWSQRIIEFIGLEWDECCLNFHNTERKVGTSSNWQVRQKIYSTSKARWRNYENYLGSLLGLLDLGTAD